LPPAISQANRPPLDRTPCPGPPPQCRQKGDSPASHFRPLPRTHSHSRVEFCTTKADFYLVMQSCVLPDCLFHSRHLAATLHKQKVHCNVFPQMREPLALHRERAAALNLFPQGLKIPGSISQSCLKVIVPGLLPSTCSLGRAEQSLPSTQACAGLGRRRTAGVGDGKHLAGSLLLAGHGRPLLGLLGPTFCPFPIVARLPQSFILSFIHSAAY
jgi:hypothetical protein